MSARVIAPLVLAKDREGQVGYWYFGQEIPYLAAADRARLEADGLIAPAEPVTEIAEPVTETADPVTPPAAPVTESGRPWSTATRAVWLDYVLSRGIARVDAEELTKKELMALVAE